MTFFVCFSLLLRFINNFGSFGILNYSGEDQDMKDAEESEDNSQEEMDEDSEDEPEEKPDLDSIFVDRQKLNEAQKAYNDQVPAKENTSLEYLQRKYTNQLEDTKTVQDFLDNVNNKLTSDTEDIKKELNISDVESDEDDVESDGGDFGD